MAFMSMLESSGVLPPLATGHIQAHAVHGQHALAQDAAVRAGLEPGFFQLFLMEGTDICGRPR